MGLGRWGWLFDRLKSPFSRKIGYIRDKVLCGDLVPQGEGWPMIQKPFCSVMTQNEKGLGRLI